MKPIISRTYDHNPAHYRFARQMQRLPRAAERDYCPGDYAVGIALAFAALVMLGVLVGG